MSWCILNMQLFSPIFSRKNVCMAPHFFLILHSAQAADSASIFSIRKAIKRNRQETDFRYKIGLLNLRKANSY
jgi:hypothetical protein